MHLLDYITQEVPKLQLSDSCEKAILLMDDLKLTHLPVVNGDKYLGLLSDSQLLDIDDPLDEIRCFKRQLLPQYILSEKHMLDVISMMEEFHLSTVPVINSEGSFLGCITSQETINFLAKSFSDFDNSRILVIITNANDYSLAQIAQICESNSAKVHAMFSHQIPDSTKIEVHLKISINDIGGLLQAFNRYQYEIKTSYEPNQFQEDLQNRYEQLMRFINT